MSLRVAVIGAGHIGSHHLAAYHSHPESEIVAVCDLVKDKAIAATQQYGGTPYSNLAEMLAKEEIDSVSVVTAGAQNGSHHYGPAMQCFAAGKHVLCEKPLSNQLSEARSMVARAKQSDVRFGCDLNHRFTPQAETAKKWVNEGKVGTLLLANMTLWIDNPADRSPWFHLRALHPHSLDVLRYFCGKAVKVHAFFNRGPSTTTEDGKRVCWSNAQLNIQFENGVVGHLTGSYDANPRLNLERCEVMGTAGRFVIDNCFEKLTFYPRNSDELTVLPNPLFGGLSDFESTIGRRVHHWVNQLHLDIPQEQIDASGADGLAVQEIIEAAILSWDENRVVDIENG